MPRLRRITCVALACALTSLAQAQSIPAHANINEYWGTYSCLACHQDEAADMFCSVHYQWSGATPRVVNVNGIAGKALDGFNTYCGTPENSLTSACWSCHPGLGRVPDATLSLDQLENIDCLICHQDQYQRKAGPAVQLVSVTDYLGGQRTLALPYEDAAGNREVVPDEAHMNISLVDAARTVHMPTRATCLRCHAYAGGGDGTKRGDISSATVNPARTSDVHMSPQGADHNCQDCHQFNNHRVRGRGLDLLPNDDNTPVACTSCHPNPAHSDSRIARHLSRVACQTCHIPTYAKDVSTETARDWRTPVWSPTMFNGQGGYKPGETRGTNLAPTYGWFDGTSTMYALGQVATLNSKGDYELAAPRGTVTSNGAQIFPMKEHRSVSARHTATGQLIPHVTSTYFLTGNWSQSVQEGMASAGLTGAWTTVNVHNFQTLNHGVQPKESALTCGKCHAYYASGQPTVLDLKGALGYAPKAANSTICRQCHGSESGNFSNIHSRHVTNYKYDCIWCHNFTRPERGLSIPSNMTDSDKDKVINTYDNCPSLSNLNQADADRDGVGDLCDKCPNDYDPTQTDSDLDGVGNACDNCPTVANANQADYDHDRIGDLCDTCQDSDGDGFGDPGFPGNLCPLDNCPAVFNPDQLDTDGDGVGEPGDWCPGTLPGTAVDTFGCPLPYGDMDYDIDVDQEDFGLFQACITGPTMSITDPKCHLADLNGDELVDSNDLDIFKKCHSGPNVAPLPNCRSLP